MDVHATAKFVRVSPRKVRLLLQGLRGLPVDDALMQLRFTPRPAAKHVAKVVESAAANAENNYDLDPEALRIKSAFADDARTLRRYRAKARGRVGLIQKRTSHITVVVSDDEE